MPARDSAPVLAQRDLNRALFARQLLRERVDQPIPRVLELMGGLQAQYAPAMYIGLWTRMANVTRQDVTDALVRKTVVQGTLLRSTIHLVSAEDYWPFAIAVTKARRDWFLRVTRADAAAVVRAAKKLSKALADGPLRRTEIEALVSAPLRNGVGLWLDLVRVPPSGTWERRRADLYMTAAQWLGPPPPLTAADAMQLLVRRYLGGFGPARRAEIADWAGVPVADVTAALQQIDVRRFRGESGAELVDLPDAPLPPASSSVPVRFLPVWDASLLVHARRTGVLPEEYRSRIFSSRTPHSFNTVLVDGAVAGTWRYEKGALQIEEFAPIGKVARRQVDEEAERLAAFHT